MSQCSVPCDSLWAHVAHQDPLSMGFSHKNSGVGCYFLLQRIFPTPEIEPMSPALAGRFFITEPPGVPPWINIQF